MLNDTVLSVAIGLVFVFLMLSVACSMLNESIQGVLETRAKMLEGALLKLLGRESTSPFDGVKQHSLIQAIAHTRSGMPSYIPSSTFVQALFDTLVPADGEFPLTLKRLRDAVMKLPATSRTALLALINTAEDDLATLRANVEHWFDGAMERLSGAYKRHITLWLFALGFVLAAATNADSIQLTQRLQHETALRAVVTAQAEQSKIAGPPATVDPEQLQKLDLLFWDVDHLTTAADGPRYPRAARAPELSLSWLQWLLFKIAGFVMTALAMSLGAPFWFELLQRLVNLRATGSKPPTATERAAQAK